MIGYDYCGTQDTTLAENSCSRPRDTDIQHHSGLALEREEAYLELVMSEVLQDIKSYARTLHRAIQAGEHDLLSFVNHRSRQPVDLDNLQRRHVLAAVARRLGFRGWSHLTAVFAGTEADHGTLLCPPSSFGTTNIWSASYDEAAQIRAQNNAYLLTYKRQFVVVQAPFIDALGARGNDPDWQRMGFDWAKPKDVEARDRLMAKVVRTRLGAG